MGDVTRPHFEEEIVWHETGDAEFPYQAHAGGRKLKIRLNDFPDEPLYTLLGEDLEPVHFDDWPRTWRKVPSTGEETSGRHSAPDPETA